VQTFGDRIEFQQRCVKIAVVDECSQTIQVLLLDSAGYSVLQTAK
jgi:hypothetical protein